jgi:hypothetical protein
LEVEAAPSGVVGRRRTTTARRVGNARVLDLDDVGAHQRQLVRAERPRQHVRQVDDAYRLERPHVLQTSLTALVPSLFRTVNKPRRAARALSDVFAGFHTVKRQAVVKNSVAQ